MGPKTRLALKIVIGVALADKILLYVVHQKTVKELEEQRKLNQNLFDLTYAMLPFLPIEIREEIIVQAKFHDIVNHM